MNLALLPGHTDAAVQRIAKTGTTEERAAAQAELIRRGGYTVEQKRGNRKPKPFVPTEGGFGWGGRA